MTEESILSDDELLIVFATAPTGLGHIRVTDALFHGLPEAASPVLLGAQNRSIDTFYRFISIHPYTRFIMEFLQTKSIEKISTPVLRYYFRAQTKLLYQQFITILGERLTVPKTILVVATHSALAHQIAVFKEKLEKDTNTKIILLVQVTDDSPQFFWYVPEADLIFVPSEYTRIHLAELGRKANLKRVPISVNAYPVSPLFANKLSATNYESRINQLKPAGKITNISIPVSGAAIGTKFLIDVIKNLHKTDKRFAFHIVSKEAYYTKNFILQVKKLSYVNVYTSSHDRTTVNNYENLLIKETISLEITKPSEQTFKALCAPYQIGGVILLFSKPVGRQEYDNIHFLRVRKMMPSIEEQFVLWECSRKSEEVPFELRKNIVSWRALSLPEDPYAASIFISWCIKQEIFLKMIEYKPNNDSKETRSDGVKQFWQQAVSALKESST